VAGEKSVQWNGILAIAWLVLAAGQDALAVREGGLIGWLLALGFAALAGLFASRWMRPKGSSGAP
jgi:hypothetical protein